MFQDSLLRRAKKRAAELGVSLSAFVETAVREAIASGTNRRSAYVFNAVVCGGKKPPAIDPADRRNLYENLDADRKGFE